MADSWAKQRFGHWLVRGSLRTPGAIGATECQFRRDNPIQHEVGRGLDYDVNAFATKMV